MEAKRILVLANLDLGLYKFRKELLGELLEKGNEIHIALPYGELVEPLIQMGCKYEEVAIERRGMNPFHDFKLMWQYSKLLHTIKPNKVITYTVKPNVYGGLMCRLFRTTYYANITGLGTAFQKEGYIKRLTVKLYKWALKNANFVFFENSMNMNVFLDHAIIRYQQAVKLNGAGVNLQEYFYTPMKLEKELHFLFIGRIMREKGIEELFEVAKRIKSKYPYVNFEVIGPFEEDYKEVVEQLSKYEIIRYHGYQKDVKPFIEQAQCFILPSYHEGMANTLLEAGAMGRPLITSDIAGCKEAVMKNGYTVRVGDVEDLYDKVEQFILLQNEEKVAMGKWSRKLMEERFSKERVVESTLYYISR